MKGWLLPVIALYSGGVVAGDYVHLMTTEQKCHQWGERGKQIVHEFYRGVSREEMYRVIDSVTSEKEIADIQKTEVDAIYNNLPQTDNGYEQVMYAAHIEKAAYEQCQDLYNKQ